jgi:putative phage-type endonuclease
MYKISEFPQRSPEWYLSRCGWWTASFFDSAITPTGKASISAENIVNRLVAEIIAGKPDDTFQTEAMLRGVELEDEALQFINFAYDYSFEKCGLVQCTNYNYGASPDGIDLKNKIGLELKCPSLHTHIEYISAGSLPNKYKAQVQGSMLVTGFSQWVFMSYFPGLKPLVITVQRDEEYIKAMKEILIKNCLLVQEKLKTVNAFLDKETA